MADSAFWQRLDIIQQSQLSPRHRMLLVSLWRLLGDDDRAFPKQPALAAAVGVSVRQLQRMLSELEDVVSVQRSQHWTFYAVNWQAIKDGAGASKLTRCDTRVATEIRHPCRNGYDTRVASDTTPVSHLSSYGNQEETNVKPQGQRKPAAGDETIFPEGLDSEAFREAWSDWLAYRRERRLSVKPMTLNRQLQKLADIGPEQAAACIDASITNGWQGLFPERQQQRTAGGGSERVHRQMREFAAWAAEDDE